MAWPEPDNIAQAELTTRTLERDAFEAAEHGSLEPAEGLHTDRQRDEDAHSRLEDDAINEFERTKDRPPNVAERRHLIAGLRGTLWKLATQAAKSAVQGYREKVQKYTNLNITSGVAPLSITAWGFAQRDLEKALPFKEMVTKADGDKQVVLEAAKMKDQWRRRVGLILLQENSFALRAYMTQNSSRWRPRGRGRTAGWSDEHD